MIELDLTTIILGLLSFAIMYRNYGGFYYRTIMSSICLIAMSIYGFCISLIFPLLGYTHLINYSVAKGYMALGGFFTGIKVVGEGQENLEAVKDRPAIYVCNHQSSLDIMFMGVVYPKNTAIVAKKQLKYVPFMGWFMTLSNAIFLDRGNRDNAVKAAKDAAADIHKKNTNVWIFPEGTRGHESEITLLPFKKGAFYMAVQAKVPIVPVVIASYYDLYSAKEKRFKAGTLRCRVLPAISTDNVKEESADIEKLANACRDQMLVALKEITPARQEKK